MILNAGRESPYEPYNFNLNHTVRKGKATENCILVCIQHRAAMNGGRT